MIKWIRKSCLILGAVMLVGSVFAEDNVQYNTRTLPDGSKEMTYTSSDGTNMRQVQHPDGTIETIMTDKAGNQTKSVQHANGNVESSTTNKQPQPQQ